MVAGRALGLDPGAHRELLARCTARLADRGRAILDLVDLLSRAPELVLAGSFRSHPVEPETTELLLDLEQLVVASDDVAEFAEITGKDYE